jgi:hypothetical protein
MNELISEIESDIRREKFDRLWKRFGKIMVGVSVAVVLVTIGIVIMQNQKQARAMASTAEYIRGIDRMNVEDFKGAISVFEGLASDASSPYYGMAQLQKARAQEALGDKDGAAKTYAQLASHDSVFGRMGALAASAQNTSQAEPDKSSPFFYTQSEWKAWNLLSAGKKNEAVAVFMMLREDLDAPMTLRSRANDVVQHIAPEKLQETQPAAKGKPNA